MAQISGKAILTDALSFEKFIISDTDPSSLSASDFSVTVDTTSLSNVVVVTYTYSGSGGSLPTGTEPYELPDPINPTDFSPNSFEYTGIVKLIIGGVTELLSIMPCKKIWYPIGSGTISKTGQLSFGSIKILNVSTTDLGGSEDFGTPVVEIPPGEKIINLSYTWENGGFGVTTIPNGAGVQPLAEPTTYPAFTAETGEYTGEIKITYMDGTNQKTRKGKMTYKNDKNPDPTSPQH